MPRRPPQHGRRDLDCRLEGCVGYRNRIGGCFILQKIEVWSDTPGSFVPQIGLGIQVVYTDGSVENNLFDGKAGKSSEDDRAARVDKGAGGGNGLVGARPEDGEKRGAGVVSFEACLIRGEPQSKKLACQRVVNLWCACVRSCVRACERDSRLDAKDRIHARLGRPPAVVSTLGASSGVPF